MNLAELEHSIRAACSLLNTKEVYIVGSQSILASFPNLSGPIAQSAEVDVLPIMGLLNEATSEQQAADLINGNLGEGTLFDDEYGYMIEGVTENDLSLPPGWRERTKPICNDNTFGCTGHCLDPYDMATGKIAAGRDKDKKAIINLVRQGILKPMKLKDRVGTLEPDKIFDLMEVKDLLARVDRWCCIANGKSRDKGR